MFPEFEADKIINKMRMKNDWNDEKKNKYLGMTNEQIKEGWKKNGEEASGKGTILHETLENYWNSVILGENPDPAKAFDHLEPGIIKVQHFLDFCKHIKEQGLRPFRMEWKLFDENLCLAGTPDVLFEKIDDPFDVSGKLVLGDWKRSREIKMDNRFDKGFKNTPLFGMDSCNYNHYTIQLNVYKHLLEKHYGTEQKPLKIIDMFLVIFYPTNESFVKVPIINQDVLACQLMEYRKSVLEGITWIPPPKPAKETDELTSKKRKGSEQEPVRKRRKNCQF